MSVSAVTVTNLGGYLVQIETLQGPGGTQTVQSVLGPATGTSGSGQSDADGGADASAVLGADQTSLPDTVSQLRQNAQSQDTAVPWLQGQPTHRRGDRWQAGAPGASASAQNPMSALARALQPYGAAKDRSPNATLPWLGAQATSSEACPPPLRRRGPHRPHAQAPGTRPLAPQSGDLQPPKTPTNASPPLTAEAQPASQPSWLTRSVRTDGTI